MSADNEIAVVRFPDGNFRVVEIRGCPDATDYSFLASFNQQFQEAQIHTSQANALQAAEELCLEIEKDGYVEYGITLWDSRHPLEHYGMGQYQ